MKGLDAGLNAALQSLDQGLSARGYTRVALIGARSWRTRRAGRDIRLKLAPHVRHGGEFERSRLLGFSLGFSCSTTVHSRLVWWAPTRLVKAWPVSWWNRRRGLQVLEFPELLPPGRALLAVEPDWATRIAHSPALEVVAAWLNDPNARGCVGSLVLFPGRWEATAPTGPLAAITPEAVEQRVNTLIALAEQVEALPPPRHPVSLTPFERWAAAHPALYVAGLLLVSLGLIGLATLTAVAAGVSLFWALR